MNMTQVTLAGLACVLLLNSCTPYQTQGAGVGALGGAAIGALAGNDGGDVLRGAAIGAAVGTGVAAIQEEEARKRAAADRYYRDREDDRYRNQDEYRDRDDRYDYQDAPRSRETTRRDYPVAERTAKPNQVISPYGPKYNVIDVTGFRSGQLARDPSNGKIFRVP